MTLATNYAHLLRDQVFPRVQKPARYIGGEWNMVSKDLKQVRSRVVLAFPDVYEIGICYLGFQILYELLNQITDVYAERVYCPWGDMESVLRENKLPLCSLETSTPLNEFHFIGITLQHELSYTNVLNLLDLGGIPLRRGERQEHCPLVLGGGPGVANPEPLAEFFDLFVLGDAEKIFPEIIRKDQDLQGQSRKQRIQVLSQLPGVYSPENYHPVYAQTGEVLRIEAEAGAALPIRRLKETPPPAPQNPLVPYLGATHDRVSAEIFRGCTRGCRFCQAGMITRPVRERDPQAVLDQLMAALNATGYEEASLTSLSTGDYTQLLPLAQALMQEFSPRCIALSFPSLRLDSFQSELAELIREVRKTGLTFAPEAGSQRLRRVINKCLDEEPFIQNLVSVFQQGWDLVKLYFMIGLPTESEEDIAAISYLVRKIMATVKTAMTSQRKPRVHLGISLFVPKPHTPFQWEGQLPRPEAAKRFQQLARELPRAAGFMVSKRQEQELNRSYLEAVLARGDRRLWSVIQRAWELGARFDSWGEEFHFELWEKAFAEQSLDPDFYALRNRSQDFCLPWAHLDMGINQDYLKRECERAYQTIETPDCRLSQVCNDCGVLSATECPLPPAQVPLNVYPKVKALSRPEREQVRIRLRYKKGGDMRFLGHLDLVNLFRRAVRRAELPVHYSLGFHPQPALAFGPPLPLGYWGLGEWLDIGLDRWLDPREVVEVMNHKLPAGVQLEAGHEIPLTAPALNERINAGEYLLEIPDFASAKEWSARLQVFLQAEIVWKKQRSKHGMTEVNLRPAVIAVQWLGQEEGSARIKLLHKSNLPGAAKVSTLVEYFSPDPQTYWKTRVTRTFSGVLYHEQITLP